MSSPPPAAAEQAQLQALKAAVERADLTVEQVWVRYFALGGEAGPVEIEAHLQGLMVLPPLQGDVLAQAINERLDELAGTNRVPYLRSIREARPATGSLAALVQLLDRARSGPPERIAALASDAAEALGVHVGLYLVDDEQRRLVPLDVGGIQGQAHDVEGTAAGQAFRTMEIPPVSGDPPRLWVPVLDGVHRLGVLEVTAPIAADLDEPVLRERCGWLATALAHLLVMVAERGDSLAIARRRRSPSPASELISALLPPPSAGAESCQLAGLLEPSAEVAGDVFDYALSDTTAAFAVFDVPGRALRAGLLAAAVVAAYRSARRNGRGLADQALAIEEELLARFGAEDVLTGVLGELDLRTGQFGYLAAGSPYPYLLHSGVAVPLTGGRCLPLGLGTGAPRIPGQHSLEPGDWLVLYTDGVAEGRDEAGVRFGEERLRDVLERGTAPPTPAAEAARRLMREVVDHQYGALRDDAAVLLARWSGPGPAD